MRQRYPALPARPRVLEIGGNIGACTLAFAAIDCEVTVFEPLPKNFAMLAQNLRLNPQLAERVQLYPFAASDHTEESVAHCQAGNAGNTVVVPKANADPKQSQSSLTAQPLEGVVGGNYQSFDVWSLPLRWFLAPSTDQQYLNKAMSTSFNIHRGKNEQPNAAFNFVKMDCQGCEPAAIRELFALCKATRTELPATLAFEYSPVHWQYVLDSRRHGTRSPNSSGEGLDKMDIFRDLERYYDIADNSGRNLDWESQLDVVLDLCAWRKNQTELRLP